MLSLIDMLDDNTGLVLAAVVFIATASLVFGVLAALRLHGAVRKRTAGITGGISGGTLEAGEGGGDSLRDTGLKAVQRLIDYTTRHYSSFDESNMKVLRGRLVQAGLFDPRAVGFFFLARFVLAIGCGCLFAAMAPLLPDAANSMFWALVGLGGIVGYLVPSLGLDRIIARRRAEYRIGFPDFMDLLVVCADAGLAMEAALERVGRELAPSYPALATNIHITNLEIRAGRSLTDALEHFAARLSLDEAKSFATLIQQSAELGSSITEALRVYSEDMRHKRLSIAEEKAYALPAKLSFPLMVCVFPVLFVVILLPVFVRIKLGVY
jgi:tight adherence protein C